MRKNRYLLHFGAPSVLLAMQSAIWAYVWVFYYSGETPRQIYWKGHLLVAAVYFVILLLVANFYGGLRVGYYRVSDVALSGTIALFLVNFVTWGQVCLMCAAIVPAAPVLAMTAIQCGVAWIWAWLTETIYMRRAAPRRILMLYSGPSQARKLVYKLITRSEKYQVQKSVNVQGEHLEALCPMILSYQSVIFCDIPPPLQHDLNGFCFRNNIRVYTVPSVYDILTRGAAEMNLFDTPLLLSRNQGLSSEQRVAKRAMDILIAGAALVVLLPLMLVTALAVKLYDGGPVFFSQERLTLGGRRFMMYKFRSMKTHAEKSGVQLSTRGDSRVTAVGKIMRPLRLDEIPQLINILKGDMSIVGPRPERPEIADEYCKVMPEFAYRLKVKAGLTGYAQVYGSYNTDPWDKLLMDLIYISGNSLAMDFKIIFMTVKILFQKERAEGIAKGNTTALDNTESKDMP